MLGPEGEHVIKKADAGVHRSIACAVNAQAEGNRGFAGGAADS